MYPYLAYQTLFDLAAADASATTTRAARTRPHLSQGHPQGPAQDHLEDGHLDDRRPPRRAAFEIVGPTARSPSFVSPARWRASAARASGPGRRLARARRRRLRRRRTPVAGWPAEVRIGGEYHAYNLDVVGALQSAVAMATLATTVATPSRRLMPAYRHCATLLELRGDVVAILLDEVTEPVESILKRFDSAGMSLRCAVAGGAHETLAQAMNRLGARSGIPAKAARIRRATAPTACRRSSRNSALRRHPGVLISSTPKVPQIKVAQGAKPGEGGQLPGHKVNDLIARLHTRGSASA